MSAISKLEIDVPGLDEEMRETISKITEEFESEHERDIVRDGPGWIPRIQPVDYIIGWAINIAIIIWLIAALV